MTSGPGILRQTEGYFHWYNAAAFGEPIRQIFVRNGYILSLQAFLVADRIAFFGSLPWFLQWYPRKDIC